MTKQKLARDETLLRRRERARRAINNRDTRGQHDRSCFRVLNKLLALMKPELGNISYCSARKIADDVGLSISQVTRYLEALVAIGAIRVVYNRPRIAIKELCRKYKNAVNWLGSDHTWWITRVLNFYTFNPEWEGFAKGRQAIPEWQDATIRAYASHSKEKIATALAAPRYTYSGVDPTIEMLTVDRSQRAPIVASTPEPAVVQEQLREATELCTYSGVDARQVSPLWGDFGGPSMVQPFEPAEDPGEKMPGSQASQGEPLAALAVHTSSVPESSGGDSGARPAEPGQAKTDRILQDLLDRVQSWSSASASEVLKIADRLERYQDHRLYLPILKVLRARHQPDLSFSLPLPDPPGPKPALTRFRAVRVERKTSQTGSAQEKTQAALSGLGWVSVPGNSPARRTHPRK